MLRWEACDRARAPDGGELTLLRAGDSWLIRVGSRELMGSDNSHSEEEMARIAISRLPRLPRSDDTRPAAPRVLIGGLGMGFTARAALDALPASAELIIAEIVPAVVAWNRGPLSHLARAPLADARARVEQADVGRLIAQTKTRFDAILLDVDNGPEGLTRPANELLYGELGLTNVRRALRPGGILAVWSAAPSPSFEKQLRRSGFATDTVRVHSAGSRGGRIHTLFFGQVQSAGPGK